MADHKKIDKRIIRTRQWLSKAFLELLEEKGLQKMTVQDITERANVNRATFYAHYEDKYDLFNTIIDHTFQQKLASKIPPLADSNLGNLRMLILAVFEYLGQLNELYESWIATFSVCPVLTVPSDDLDYVANSSHLDLIGHKVQEKLTGKEEVVFDPEELT